MRIDSHHHLWSYSADQYGWINDEMTVLQADYLTQQLGQIANDHSIDGFVTVQARQSLDENDTLLALAQRESRIRGIVGWVPLVDPSVGSLIEKYASQDLIKGFRHVVQDEPDDRFLLREDFNRGIAELAGFDLVYDILVYARQLSASIEFVDRHPSQRFVLDHIAKPTIRSNQFDQSWADDLRELAKRDHVVCKFSGIVTEVRDQDWSIDLIRPYWDVVLDAFAPERIMFGSDWPVCLLRAKYADWLSTMRELTSELSGDEQSAIFGDNAVRVYRLADCT